MAFRFLIFVFLFFGMGGAHATKLHEWVFSGIGTQLLNDLIESNDFVIPDGDAPEHWTTIANVSIAVAKYKDGARGWDYFPIQPDLTFCLSEDGSEIICVGQNSIRRAHCDNVFNCSLNGIRIPDGEFAVWVFDIDTGALMGSKHDLVEYGICSATEQCNLGRAIITFSTRDTSE